MISKCCGADCYYARDDEPCWGNVEVVDEFYDEEYYEWIHACEGHEDVSCGGKYKSESK